MKTLAEKQRLRKKLLEACIAKQQLLIDDFKDRIKALTETHGLGNEESYDNQVVASNSATVLEINALNDLLEFANRELEILQSLVASQDVIRDRVAPGAIVVTNYDTFFVCASIEEFHAAGHTYVGISTSSPIYRAMEGKCRGEAFIFQKIVYKIEEVF